MVFVAGATGFLGTEICRRLIEHGKKVRGLVRESSDSARVQALKDMGVETVVGDLKDPDSLPGLLNRVHSVISTATSTRSRSDGDGIESVDADGQLNMIRAASDAQIGRYVLLSYTGNIQSDDPLTRAKRNAERHLIESGMTYTILRPSIFMEGWLSPALGFDYPNARVQIFGDGEQKISYISLGDVAEFAVRSLETKAACDTIMELGGPEAISPNEVIRIFEETTGRKFEVARVPKDALQAQFESAEDAMSRSFAALMLAYAQGDPVPMARTLRKFPLRLTSVHDYAAAVASVNAVAASA